MRFCPNLTVLNALPEFQRVKEYYADRHYCDDHLAIALQLFREKHADKYADDWFPETSRERAVFTRFLNQELRKAKLSETESTLGREDIVNVYGTLYELYTPEQLANRLKMIAADFRAEVDAIEEADRTGRSRQELIKAQAKGDRGGFIRILDRVFARYGIKYASVEHMMSNYDANRPDATPEQREAALKKAEYVYQEMQTVLLHKDRLAALAAIKIGENEGFAVRIDGFKMDIEDLSEEELNEPYGATQNDDGTDGTEGAKGDRYADYRTLKLMSTLGPRARRLISRIVKTDSKGRVIKDDLGKPQYLDSRQAAIALVRTLVNSRPETMMSDLVGASDYYPWMKGLVKELIQHPQLQQTVYCSFKKAATIYVYANLEKQKEGGNAYVPHIANSRSSGHVLMREAGGNLQAGYVMNEPTSVYTETGQMKSLATIKAIREKFKALKEKIQDGTKNIRMVDGDARPKSPIHEYEKLPPVEAMKEFLRQNPEVTQEVSDFLRGLGYSITPKDVETVALQTMTRKGYGFIVGRGNTKSLVGRNKLYQLVDWMGAALARAEKVAERGEAKTGQYFYSTTTDEFRRMDNCLALAKYDEVESRVNNDGKSMSTYNSTNLIHQITDVLKNAEGLSEEDYQRSLEQEYLQYEGMSLGKGQQRKNVGWLRMFAEGRYGQTDMRQAFRLYSLPGFNHVDYAKMTRGQKLSSAIVQFFGASAMFSRGEDQFCGVEFPIQSDYTTAYDFMYVPRLKVGELLDESTGEYGYQSEIVDALVEEVLVELERIQAIEERVKADPDGVNRPKLSVYEREGMKFQIFPSFNIDGFRKEYTSFEDPKAAEDYVRRRVAEELGKIREKDIQLVEESGVLSNWNLHTYGLYAKDGKVKSLSLEAQKKLDDWFFNTFYARLQMIKLYDGGLHNFNGLIDFEKRNMLAHATHTSLYTEAMWDGKKVGKQSQKVVYVADEVSQSAFLDDIMGMLKDLLDEGLITPIQYKSMKKAYSKIKSTDGQGFRTLESYREVMIMTDQWDDRHEHAYQRIMEGTPTKDDIDIFMQPIKPVTTGFEHVDAVSGEHQKPVKLTVLHKYSEVVLLPVALAKHCLSAQSVPLRAFDLAQKELGVDMFLFHSGAKVGAHSVISPFMRWGDFNDDKERKAHGWKGEPLTDHVLKDEESIRRYIVDTVSSRKWYVHEIPYKYYGIAASTPPHGIDDKIARASQKEKTVWANIKPGDKIIVNGHEMEATKARDLYYAIKTATIVDQYRRLRETFENADELERILQEELASKSYQPQELKFALSHLKEGTFALPLFSPGVEHQVQELLSSIIKKRLTKVKTKGANVLVSTALGMEVDVSAYQGGFPDSFKLGMEFEGKGKQRHLKWFDAGLPLPDALREFADKDGNITPEMLWGRDGTGETEGLVHDGVIPLEALLFDASRTPSDAEHSTVPCRIKWFSSKLEGGSAKLAKEAMVTTGQDFDGDKLRMDFKEYDVVWDFEKMEADYDALIAKKGEAAVVKMMLGQDDDTLKGFASWKRWMMDKDNPEHRRYRKVRVVQYDESKSPLENSERARHNMMMQLTFGQLTSPEGSRRVLIPGGCEESKIYAKTLQLIRLSVGDDAKNLLFKTMTEEKDKGGLGMTPEAASEALKNTVSLYKKFLTMDDGDLTALLRAIGSTDTPYTLTHSVEAFEYLMGGAEMIGIYALYNSAQQMLQRLDMHYVPYKASWGAVFNITLFGHKIDKLFDIKNGKGNLLSLGLARLLNAAVDNGKDPILGYLSQTKEMAEITSFLFAAGIDEEEVHLIMNQPAVRKLIERLKSRDSDDLDVEVQKLVDQLQGQFKDEKQKLVFSKSFEVVEKMSKDDYVSALPKSFDSYLTSQDVDEINRQTALLYVISHIAKSAGNLAEFIRLTRPESNSGAIGSTIADITGKVISLAKFRKKLNEHSDMELGISGMRGVLRKRDIGDASDKEFIMSELGTELQEVVALNTLMMDSSLDMFKPFFPQARMDWVETVMEISDMYRYKTPQKGLIEHIAQEMILWKLLSDKKFVGGNPQEEQRRILIDVPKQLHDLKQRIEKAKQNPGTDKAAEALVGNVFLEKLSAIPPANSTTNPRIVFSLNGPAVEGTADSIRGYWNELLNSEDEGVRKLAVDLFLYNMYTNGFGYGMYEFAHFAPFSVLARTPGYLDAMERVLTASWSPGVDKENFINQYIMNHWGDKSFLPMIPAEKLPNAVRVPLGLDQLSPEQEAKARKVKENARYIVVTTGTKKDKKYILYRLDRDSSGRITPVKATMLGVRLRGGQVTLQYNPTIDYHFVEPVVVGNDSPWGFLDTTDDDAYAQSNFGGDPMSTEDWIQYSNSFGGLPSPGQVFGLRGPQQAAAPSGNFGGLPSPASVFGMPALGKMPTVPQVQQTEKLEEKAAELVEKNGEMPAAPAVPDTPASPESEPIDFDMSSFFAGNPALQAAVLGTSTSDEDLVASQPITRSSELEDLRSRALAAIERTKRARSADGFDMRPSVESVGDGQLIDYALEKGAISEDELPDFKMFSIARRDREGNPIVVQAPASPLGIREARRQQAYVELNRRLRELLKRKGVSVGVLSAIETRMALQGVTDFDTAQVTAEGLVEMIRIADGFQGEQALPEEFAHLAIEMLGHDQPLVARLLSMLESNEDALREAFGDQYDDYLNAYSNDMSKMALEAAGKLVAKNMLRQQELETRPIRRIVQRVVDAIKEFLRRFRRDEIQNAILDANQISSKLARELLGGRILDDRTLNDIKANGELYAKSKEAKADLSGKSDILHRILKVEVKRLSVYRQRIGYDTEKAKKSASIQATERQIKKLEQSIANHKTEDAIITYMVDSLEFIEKAYDRMEQYVASGYSANTVCKHLNLVRDTLYSFSSVLEAVNAAIAEGEIQDSVQLTDAISKTSTALSKFFQFYNRYAMRYFEEMLSNVYGEHGITVDIGREKGRTITIHEMARRADGDISLASRWFHALADCNDYVLKAIDDVTRTAKYNARRHALALKPRIEQAVADLEKETGSRDQTFMFEMKRYDGGEWCDGKKDDGKLHKTGRYISVEESRHLSPARKKFYDTMMDIKREADKYLPDSLLEQDKIVMVRKYTWDRVKESDGIKNKTLEVWEGIRNSILDTSDSIDYDNYEVRVDFEGNRIDMLPVHYVAKGKNESYDDMIDDVATSIMAYAGMAFEYGEMNDIIGMLENAKFMASQRDVVQKTGRKTQRETIETDDTVFHEPYTVKQAETNMQQALEDFFQMHIYGHIQANEGTIGNTRISKRKVVDFINGMTSLSQMAINIPQRIANISTGLTQILLESVGRGVFTAKDTAWASKIYMLHSADRIAETGETDYDDKLSLWLDRYDVHQDNGRSYKTTKYGSSRVSRVFNSSLLYAGLTMGEDYLASTTALSVARNFKMKGPNGEESNLWDAFEVKYTDPATKTGAYLSLRKGFVKADGSPLTAEDERKFAKAVAGLNFELQGIYNLDDRSAVQQYALGALFIMYRKWIAPALKRRYSDVQYNALKGSYEEGYHHTLFRLLYDSVVDAKNQVTEEEGARALVNIIQDMKALRNAILMNWNKLNDYEKSNVKRACTELGVVAGLWGTCAFLGKNPPEYDDDERGKMLKWWDQTVLSQMLRLRTELGAMAPTPMFIDEAMHILNSPFAAIGPLQNTINAFQLLVPSNYMTEIKSGRYRGHVKAYKYFRELPVISMFKKVDNFLDPSPLINYYQNDASY